MSSVLTKRRTLRRIGYRLKRAMRKPNDDTPIRKEATLADIESKLRDYRKTQGRADFTGPRVIINDR